MRIGIECGQRWYRLHSWYCRYPQHYHYGKPWMKTFRRWPGGIAIGPIMIVRGTW